MPAQTLARAIGLTINGTTYTTCFSGLKIGFDSWQQGTGILRKTGEITLVEVLNGPSLDPRDNDDFTPGNTVIVTWNGNPHPLAGNLLVLSPPTVEPILSELPTVSGNLRLTVQIGCRLAYHLANQPDDDQSGVTLGSGQSANTVARTLLIAGGIASGNISLGVVARTINFPLQKQGGGFVAQAGALVYCCGDSYYPGFLYCDKAGVVKSTTLNPEGAAVRAVTLGTNDRGYTPQLDGTIPPGKVRAVGTRHRVATPPACQTTRYEEEGVLRQTSERCRYEGAGLRLSLSISPSPLSSDLLSRFFTGINYTRQEGHTWEKLGLNWVETASDTTWQIYGGNSLTMEIEELNKARSALAPDLVAQSSDPDTYGRQLERAGTTITEYQFSGLEITGTRTQVWLPRVTIAPDGNTDPNDSSAFNLVLAETKITEWRRVGDAWEERVAYKRARGLELPDFVEDGTNGSYYDLIVAKGNGVRTGNTGNTQPPRPDYWEPLPNIAEDLLEASATFSASRQEMVLQIPYAFSPLQMATAAEVEGQVIWGRAYQYLVECEPSIFANQESPMAVASVVEPTVGRQFFADALTWVHTESETYCGFAGIYLGKSSGGGGIGTTRTTVAAPLVIVPAPSVPTRPEVPQGLPLDGVVNAGAYGVLRQGIVGGAVG